MRHFTVERDVMIEGKYHIDNAQDEEIDSNFETKRTGLIPRIIHIQEVALGRTDSSCSDQESLEKRLPSSTASFVIITQASNTRSQAKRSNMFLKSCKSS